MRLGTWLSILLAASLAGCQESATEPPSPASVVIVLIDTLRADPLGAYGGSGEATPNMDALARESVVFENAHSPAPWTLPAVASILTSTFPCEHEVLVDGDRVPDAIPTLAEGLLAAGYATRSLHANPYVGAMSGLDRGFELASQTLDPNGRSVGRVLPDAPFFLYLHNTAPHDPYQEQELGPAVDIVDGSRSEINARLQQLRRLTRADFAAKRPVGTTDNSPRQLRVMENLRADEATIRTLYAKDVARADQHVGEIVALLEERGVLDDTYFLLLSDHGEEFDEHRGWQHDQSVYEELLHVPLIVRLPGARHAGTRVTEPVSLVDIVPTLADWLDRPELARNARGTSFAPLVEGEPRDPAIRITGMRINLKKYFRPAHELRGDVNVVARQGSWKSVWNIDPDTLELYDLQDDPGETTNLAASEPERATSMRAATERWWKSCRPAAGEPPSETELDPAALERLRALGYAD